MSRFVDALLTWRARGRVPVIAEIKLQSAKEGRLMSEHELDLRIGQYEAGGACCVSVVTGRWFGGSLALLERARELTALPLLRKDFIVSAKALDESRAAGADAVLLTRRLLSATTLQHLADQALACGLTPFVEVADAFEAADTPLPPGCVLAVTNRDIAQRETDDGDFRHSLSLASQARRRGAAALVSASGIRDPHEVMALVAAGYDATLVATALLHSSDASAWLSLVAAGLRTNAPAEHRETVEEAC